jgi:hypothetical protein
MSVHGLSQDTPKKEQKKAVIRRASAVTQECAKLEAKQQLPGNDVGKLLEDAVRACKDYQKRTLSLDQWNERIIGLEERAAFLVTPPGFEGIIPFGDAALFRGYDTYSLFLFPSAEWQHKKDEVRALYDEFNSFGDAIGDRRLAVWFTGKSDEVDTRRSKLYCDHFGLDYNMGPYVVTIQKSPAAWRPGALAVIISLSGISTDRRVRVLNVLEQDLRNARELKQRPLLFVEIRERLLSAAERHKELLKDLTNLIKALG